MRLKSIGHRRFTAPFHGTFSHASARRARAASILVVVETASGHRGIGEGCPRAYVTGETLASCETFIIDHAPDLRRRVNDLDSLHAWIAINATAIDANPAAFCALELAILDALARERGQSLEALLGLPPVFKRHCYSAILGDSDADTFNRQLSLYWSRGFRDFKVKLSGNRNRDRGKLDALRDHAGGARYRLRLDANTLWRSAGDAIAALQALEHPLFAVEEPLAPGNVIGCATIADALGCAIVLDESALVRRDLDAAATLSAPWIVNCRVSKQGGLIRSLAFVEYAVRRGLGVIVGAHVGETSILTRAAHAVGTQAGIDPIAREGAFGTYLLTDDPVSPSLRFGDQGLLSLGEGAGLGDCGNGLQPAVGLVESATPAECVVGAA